MSAVGSKPTTKVPEIAARSAPNLFENTKGRVVYAPRPRVIAVKLTREHA